MEIQREAIQGYVQLFSELKSKVNDEQVAVLILEQLAKDARMNAILAQRNGTRESETLAATSKQIAYLRRLGVPTTPGLSKQDASRMIDEAQLKQAA